MHNNYNWDPASGRQYLLPEYSSNGEFNNLIN